MTPRRRIDEETRDSIVEKDRNAAERQTGRETDMDGQHTDSDARQGYNER